jgi:hypothetical protein
MPNKNNRTVHQRGDGTWVNKRNETSKVSGVHKTQTEAVQEARGMLQNSGGGELTIMGRDGLIRSKDTIAPGNDPRSIRDTEH